MRAIRSIIGVLCFAAGMLSLAIVGQAQTATVPIANGVGLWLTINAPNTILSPETTNPPSNSSWYANGPLVEGWSETAGNGSYSGQSTVNLVVNGTVSNHWGQHEDTIVLSGTGTMAAELNQRKYYITVPAGLTISGDGEHVETRLDNFGAISGIYSGYTASPINEAGATAGTLVGARLGYVNNNAAANSVGQWTGIEIDGFSGSGSHAGFDYAMDVRAPNSEIRTFGHLGFYGQTPPTLSGCGSGASLDSHASDSTGTVTEGTGATGCTITFNVNYSQGGNPYPPHCIISSPNGAPFTGYSTSYTTLTITNASASGNQYTYACFGSV